MTASRPGGATRSSCVPRLPYRNAAFFAWCGLKLFARYVEAHGKPDLVASAWRAECRGRRAGRSADAGASPTCSPSTAPPSLKAGCAGGSAISCGGSSPGAQHCLAVSPQLAELLSQQYPGSRWRYLPNPLGAAFVEDADALQRDPAAPFVFVCVARLSPEKGHARLIEAFAAAFADEPDVRLRLAGDGPMRRELQRLCAAQGVAGQVEFLGVLTSEQVRDEIGRRRCLCAGQRCRDLWRRGYRGAGLRAARLVTASGGPDHLVNGANGIADPDRTTRRRCATR